MNYIKKLGTMGRSSADQRDHALGLTHLRKLFAEFRHPTRKATQEEQEYKLYNMIPLFVKVPSLYLQDVYCYTFFLFLFLPPPPNLPPWGEGVSSRSLEGKVYNSCLVYLIYLSYGETLKGHLGKSRWGIICELVSLVIIGGMSVGLLLVVKG